MFGYSFSSARPAGSSLAMGILLTLGLAACKKDSPEEYTLVYSTVSTLAGTGVSGNTNGAGTMAQFYGPEGMAIDAQGNVYVADAGNDAIRKISPAGLVTAVAGNGSGFVNGAATIAKFNGPSDVAFDGAGNLYIADFGNNCIRKITPVGQVSTFAGAGVAGFADGPTTAAQFNGPNGVAVDGQGVVYVADCYNNRIRKIMPNGNVSTLAGSGQRGFADGPAGSAQFVGVEGLALDSQGTLYVADFSGERIRRVTQAGVVSTMAGTGVRGSTDGAANTAQFYGPTGIAFDAQGNLFVADDGNNCVRKITPAGEVSTVAGTRVAGFADGPAATAQFESPLSLVAGPRGVLYLGEYGKRIRKIAAQ